MNLLAMGLGYNLTRYVKFLIAQKAAAVNESIPTFKMSEKLEKRVEEVMANYKSGKTYSADSVEELDRIIRNEN